MNRPGIILATLQVLLAAALATASVPAAHFPPRGSHAPSVRLNDLAGTPVNTDDLTGKVLVLLFAELGHEKLQKASADVMAVLRDPRLPEDAIVPILIVTRPPAAGLPETDRQNLPGIVLHDPERETFGAYRIMVVPSIVVVSAERKVVHSLAAFSQQFQPALLDALLCATGAIDDAQFEATLAGPARPHQSPAEVRAGRLVQMARQLARRGMPELAEERYREAIEAFPAGIEARLGLAEVLVAQGRLDDAEAEYRRIMVKTSDSLDARLGLVLVSIRRAGPALERADSDLRELAREHPAKPRIHYLAGLLHQERGEYEQAAASYRKASELLLDSPERP